MIGPQLPKEANYSAYVIWKNESLGHDPTDQNSIRAPYANQSRPISRLIRVWSAGRVVGRGCNICASNALWTFPKHALGIVVTHTLL